LENKMIIQEYIKEFLLEDIHKTQETVLKLDELDGMNTPYEMMRFLGKNFKRLGKGSSRFVYEVFEDAVIKFGFNQAGIFQNRNEIENSQHEKEIFPRIIRESGDGFGTWILVERVIPFNSRRESRNIFRLYEGISWQEYLDYLYNIVAIQNNNLSVEEIDEMWREIEEVERKSNLARRIHRLVDSGFVNVGDLTTLTHYGVIKGRRQVVILDYGYDDKLKQQYWKKDFQDKKKKWRVGQYIHENVELSKNRL